VGDRRESGDNLGSYLVEPEGLQLQRQLPGFSRGEGEEVVDQALESLDLALDDQEVLVPRCIGRDGSAVKGTSCRR
jgi:hypothetical protein